MHCLSFKSNIPGLFILWFVFALLFLLVSIHCGLIGGEFNAIFIFNSNLPFFFISWFVSAVIFLLGSLHCGLLASQFNALFTFKIKPPCLVHFVVCLCNALFTFFQCTVEY